MFLTGFQSYYRPGFCLIFFFFSFVGLLIILKKIYRSGMYFKIMMIMANKKYCYDYYRYTEHWYLYTLLRKHQCMLIHINPSNYRYFKFWYVWGNSSSNRVCTKVSFFFPLFLRWFIFLLQFDSSLCFLYRKGIKTDEQKPPPK